ncbi:MAG: methyl-accepting chemotaxis protein [bacterium]
MKYFLNLSTRAKLIISFGLIWVLFVVVIVIAYSGLLEITRSEKELNDIHFQTSLNLNQLRSHQNLIRAEILDLMLTPKRGEQIIIEGLIEERKLAIDDIMEKLTILNTNSEFQNQLKRINNYLEEYRQIRTKEISLIKNGKIEEAKQLGISVGGEQFEKIRSIATEIGDKAAKDAEYQLTLDQKRAGSILIIFVVFGIGSMLFSLVVIILLNKTIAKPLNEITIIAKRIGEGNLNVELALVERKDEVGLLLQTFSKMVDGLKEMAASAQKIAYGDLTISIVPQSEKDILGNTFLQMLNNLRRMMKEISEGINLIASSSNEILVATTQVASGSAETAIAINETSTTVEEVRQAAQLSSQKANRVSEGALQVVQVTKDGQKAVDETVKCMYQIQNQMESVANTIVRLSEQTQQIGGIIASVTELAEQSNLLAVNAAIEAAKAGEQGKGFAVVAQEIKSLAKQSKQATVQVRNILNDIQKVTGEAVMATEQTGKAVENGVKQSTKAGESIKTMADSSNKSMDAATQIVASSHQQVIGMEQINLAMNNINQAGTENAASMMQAEKAAKDLNELGQKLKQLAEQYKT